jgi:trk system potassium uptake protein TrkA
MWANLPTVALNSSVFIWNPVRDLAGVKLADLPSVLKEERPLIAALVRDDQLIIPKGTTICGNGDLVYFISEEKNLFKHLSIFDKHATPVKRVLIVGGGRIGYRLAKRLEDQSIACKIIEKRAAQCEFLAEHWIEPLCSTVTDQTRACWWKRIFTTPIWW